MLEIIHLKKIIVQVRFFLHILYTLHMYFVIYYVYYVSTPIMSTCTLYTLMWFSAHTNCRERMWRGWKEKLLSLNIVPNYRMVDDFSPSSFPIQLANCGVDQVLQVFIHGCATVWQILLFLALRNYQVLCSAQ